MHQQQRIKALFAKMQSNTASLAEVQAITGIDPLVVRAALVNLQKEGVIYFTGKVYGLMSSEDKGTELKE